jgi:Protein O-mannosyl-transferase TMEM260-like
MNFKKVNNITGWAVFFIAFATYFLTREARGSLWDCGEFVSSAYKLQLPHPPGAPVFVLLGRFFIILFGNKGNTAANAVNLMSALASAATILFLFWTITHFARKMFVKAGEQLTGQQTFTAMGAGAVGALAYTFSDSFWFSAVEGEVYALSSFFTALVFWCMLKWEHADEHAGNDPAARVRSDRWIVFLFFMMGLSIGVHLLNLLTIPAVVMIYYYRRYESSTKGAIIAFIIGCAITGLVQLGIIQYSMKAAGLFDVFFVNSLGLPFFSGFAIYFIALTVVIAWAVRFKENISKGKLIAWFILFLLLFTLPFFTTTGSGAAQVLKFLLIAGIGAVAGYFFKPTGLKVLKLSLWSFAFMMLGYCMYFTAIIRANAAPAINMNDVDNPINLVYYLSREQYGEAPLVYGPHFQANYKPDPDSYNGISMKKGEMKYVQGKNKYIPIYTEDRPEYESEDMQLFPRIWDGSNDQGHADFYASWLNLGQYQDQQTGRTKYESPTYADNMQWLFTYQMGLMYWRYFMWDFAGKQNDIQGLGNKRDGNWISGISFIDNKRLGDQSELPDSIKNNKAHNKLYMLPFLLGIIGCVYQFQRNKKDWVVNFLLFFMTGIAVVFYLNQPGNQPRERDYAYVGSFYAFAVWIGLAVVALVKMARDKQDKLTFQNMFVYGGILTFLITLMSSSPGPFADMLMTAIYVTVLYAAFTAGITYLVRAISSAGQNARILNIATTAICLIAPLIMAQQEWDDHDRSKKTVAPDIAKDYLESCAPNAILFTFGDNDTYPLWYAQEVEGVRPDIRIINNSLLGIDWYINQLRYKINDADSLDVIWTPEQIEGHNREWLRYRAQGDKNKYYDLYDVMKNVLGKPNIDPDTKRDVGFGSFPVARFQVPVDSAMVRKNGTANATDTIVPAMQFEIPQNKLQVGLLRSDLIILNVIASNNWKRPIYFTAPYGELGFGQYIRKDGLTYRLVPVRTKNLGANWVINLSSKDNNLDFMPQNLMNKFVFASKKGVYFDEENRRHVLNLRNTYGEAAGNLADASRKPEALKLLEKCETLINKDDMPYAMTSRENAYNITGLSYLEACYKAGNTELSNKIKDALKKDFEQQKRYYEYIRINRPDLFSGFDGRDGEAARNEYFLQLLGMLEQKYTLQSQLKPNAEGNTTITNSVKPDSAKNKDSIKKP